MDQLNRDDLRRRVEEVVKLDKRNSRIISLVVNLLMYILFMAICWAMVLSNPVLQQALGDVHPTLLTVLIMLTVGWGTSLLFQAISTFMDLGFMDRQFRDRATSRALREQLFQGTTEKVKNQPRQSDDLVKLSDDGELLRVDKADHRTDGKGSVR